MSVNRPFGGYNSGGVGGGGGFSMLPPVLKVLLISNTLVFGIQMLLRTVDPAMYGLFMDFFALHSLESGSFYPWQFVTYAFLHGDFTHLFVNMLMLFFFAMEVEYVLGQKRFLTFYLLCAIGGGLAHWLISPAPVVGASGAIFGVMVALAIIAPNRPILLYFLFPIPAKYFVVFYVLMDLFAGIRGGGTVAHFAHLGGAVVGLLYFLNAMGKLPFGGGGNRSRSRGQNNQDYWQAFQNPWDQQQREQESRAQKSGFGNIFRRPNRDDDETIDAEYYDVDNRRKDERSTRGSSNSGSSSGPATHNGRVITQEEIDRILDKIAASGYSNLTEDERQILFEASKKMDERR